MIGVFAVVGTLVLGERIWTVSAVSGVVVGLALQDTLGNMFAGLAIQVEKPFRVGHWVKVGQFEGQVREITWRATKLRTKTGNVTVVPNNIVSREAITNYSEPAAPTRIEVEVGVTYETPPTEMKQAVAEALASVPRVLREPRSRRDPLLVRRLVDRLPGPVLDRRFRRRRFDQARCPRVALLHA